ncbi:hypothetical protein KZ829_21620 [Actinoplanes hulinensis]|uniref:Outer membrane channel protein CpnT-like N-terminal domain-containing protein n=1 Tax=Actinoplanes hulinensis TaxID=1144547 RepID=A0ABS7B612_9ACTN|nr:hypothetical protein [Actinoplanes hulinensis]MBW6436342.1 hypothetical protein [Actinoplanes hulinensis]
MTSILDWFGQIEEWIPGAGSWAADLLIGPIPLAYANNAYDLADQWGRLADALNEAYQEVMQAANPILENWSGDGAAQVFTQEWFAYLEGLRQTAESAAQMQRGAQNFGLEVELMKFMAALNLIMLAVSIYMLIAAAIPTAGAALGAAPGLFAACRIALAKAATTTVSKIAALELRVVMRSLATLFTKLPGAIATRVGPAVIRAAAPRIIAAAGPRITSAMTRDAIARGARTIVARGISKAVANRLAAQSLRGLAAQQVGGVLRRQAMREAQRQLSKEIRRQLVQNWARRGVQQAATTTVGRIAATRAAEVTLGKEFAKYVGVRVAFGAGFMGGGNLLGQFGQGLSGNRTEGLDWGQIRTHTIQGAAYGAGMFGGVVGHGVGGGLAGGGLTYGQELIDYVKSDGKNEIDWGAVRHSAAEGAMAGVVFGGQTVLENANPGMPHTRMGSVRIGADVQFLPGDNGGFNLASTRANGREGLLLTSDGYVAFERRGEVSVPDEIAGRSDVVAAMNQHFPSGAVDAPAPRGEGGGGAGARSGDNTTGVRQSGGDRDTGGRPQDPAPRTEERVRVRVRVPADPDGAGAGRGAEPPAGSDRPAADRSRGDGGHPPDSGTPARPEAPDRGPVAENAPVTDRGAVADRGPGADRTPVTDRAPDGDRTPAADRGPVAEPRTTADTTTSAGDRTGSATDRGAPERTAPERRADDAPPPGRPADGPARTDTTPTGPRGDGPVHDADAPPPRDPATTRADQDTGAPRDGDNAVPGRGDGDPPAGPPRDPDEAGPPADRTGEEPPLRSAGAEVGEMPTPESIRQGTVRMELHPDFPDVTRFLTDNGFRLVEDPAGPRVVIRHVYSADGKTFLHEEREVRHLDGMRWLDLEHELDHVRQMLDRFGGELGTEAYRERANGTRVELKGAQRILSAKYDTIVEYHVRLQEAIRLLERGVDPALVREHLAGVDERRALMNQKVHQRDSAAQNWRREHFSDIPSLENRLRELRTDFENGPADRSGDPGDAMTGASIRPRDEFAAYDWAERAYDRFRADDADVAEIAGNLRDVPRSEGRAGYTPAEIHQIKQHLMVEPHRITDYDGTVEIRRFDASPDIAEAWIRLREGRHLPEDLVLLNHELAESNHMRRNPEADYREAHDAANQQHNWQDIVPARTGEDLDNRWGGRHSDGAAGRLPENPRGRETGGISVRSPGDGPGAGDREGLAGGEPGGRDGGPGVRGGAHEDPSAAARTGELAGGRDVRGVDPYRLVSVDGPVPDHPVAAPHEVAAVLEAELGALVAGREAGAPDQPHRADWDAESRTLRVRYGDGLEIDVVVQVNESVPPGRSVVVRPALEPLDGGGWRQAQPAGVVLSPHVPGDPAARAPHVTDALDAAFRAVHDELGPQLRPADDGVPPRGDGPDGPSRPGDDTPPPRADGPEALRGLEETTSPDVPVRDADGVGVHRADPSEPPASPPLTPDSVRQTLTGRGGPEQLGRWAGEHLADHDRNGTPRPKSAEEIAATVDRLGDEALDRVTPMETARPEGVRHTASAIEGTDFVPDGRPWQQPDVTVGDLRQAAHNALAGDFTDGRVAYVVPDGPTVRVEMTDGAVRHFRPEVGQGMRALAETTVRSGTPDDPHIVRVNNRVAADQLSRVWVHEITETLALQHASENRAQPHGVVRRALSAIGRVFGGGEQPRPETSVPRAVRVDAHTAARLNERLHLQRLHDWAHGRPEEQQRLRQEIDGLDRDLEALGHRIPRQLFDWGGTAPPRTGLDPVIGGRQHTAPDPAYRVPDWYRNDGPETPAMPRFDDAGPETGRPHDDDGTPHDPAPRDEVPPEPVPHDPGGDGPRGPGEPRTPLRELFPRTEEQAAHWGPVAERAFARELSGRDYAGFDVRVDSVHAQPGHMVARMSVMHPDRPDPVGRITREFVIDRDTGHLEAFHVTLALDHGIQGSGFARAFNDHLEGWYAESGVSRIGLHAASTVGGYAWARAGYGWDTTRFGGSEAHSAFQRLEAELTKLTDDLARLDEAELQGDTRRVDSILHRHGIDDPGTAWDRLNAQRAAAEHLLADYRATRFGDPDFPTPYDISQAGRTDESGSSATWIGKRAMMGGSWHGSKVPEPRPEAPLRAEPDPPAAAHPERPPADEPVRPGDPAPEDRPSLYRRDDEVLTEAERQAQRDRIDRALNPDRFPEPDPGPAVHHEPARTNLDVLFNGSDVPLHPDAVTHVADLMGLDLTGVDIRLVTDMAELGHMDAGRISAVTPPEMRGAEIRFGPAAFADAETLAATVAHEHTHVVQLREGRDPSTHTLRQLEDEAFAGEAAALQRFRQGFEGWESVREGTVPDRGGPGSAEPGRVAGDGPGARGADLAGAEPAGRGDRGDGGGSRGGVRDAPQSRAEPHDAGGAARDADAGGRRPGPGDLNRPIGGRRPEEPPFGYDRFYRDPEWTPEALTFEVRLGAHYFNDVETLNAARDAVSRLRDVLTDLATSDVNDPAARAAISRNVEATFFRGDESAITSAGQVGLGVPLDALLRDGNVRELTTAFYNAAYFNRDSPHTLARTLLDVIDNARWDEARRAGIDVTELRGMERQLDHSLNRAIMGRVEERFPPSESPRFNRHPFATANVIMRSDRPFRDLTEVISSQAGRRPRSPDEQLELATTLGHYERLGAPLGRFERAFVESVVGRLDADTKLPWREGYVWHDTGGSGWATRIGRDGYPVLDGVSATTTRMLTGAKMLGIHGVAAERFLHSLIGWMLPARDHSLIELLRGASIAGVEPVAVHSRGVRPTAIDLYRNIPGIDQHTLRTRIAPDGLLPHEARYLHHALDPDGFTETRHKVPQIADRLWPQLETGRVTDADLAHWLERNGADPVELAQRLTKPHVMALTVYTRHSHYLINNVITAQMLTFGASEPAVRAVHDRKIGQLVDNYLGKLSEGEKPLPLPLALRPVLHDGPGHLDSTSPLRPAARRWLDAVNDMQAAREDVRRHLAEGDRVAARQAKAEVMRADAEIQAAREQIGRELGEVAPRLFEEVRWHADMVYDALRQLPAIGTPERPVIAYRGDWSTPVWSPIYGNRMFPDGTALSVLSVSRLPEVAVRFMAENPASDNRIIAVYKLTGVNARDISVFSSFPRDQEAVLPPGSRTRQVHDPVLEQQTRDQLPPEWRDRTRIIVLEEQSGGFRTDLPHGTDFISDGEGYSERAAEAYVRIRDSPEDTAAVAANTGIDPAVIEGMRQNLFVQQHEVPLGPNQVTRGYFTPIDRVAELWDGAREGTLNAKNLARFRSLAAHEYVEYRLMEAGLPYRSAHPDAFDAEGVSVLNPDHPGAHDLAPNEWRPEAPFRHWRIFGLDGSGIRMADDLSNLDQVVEAALRGLRR